MSASSSVNSRSAPFWRTKPFGEFTPAEWESLCDGCGKCCLHKLEDEDTGIIHFTDVACRLLNVGTCRCIDYANRKAEVPECVRLSPRAVLQLQWLPSTCAYRLLAAGKPLPWWHPLVSGDPQSVHRAGISIRGRAVPENRAGLLENHIVSWPE